MKDRICFYALPYPEIRSYFALIDASVAHGLTKLEAFGFMELREPDLEAARAIRRYADEKGVSFCCLSLFANLTGEKGAQTCEKLKQYAKVAAILGSPYLHHTVIPECWEPEKVLPHKEALLREVLPRVQEIYDYAQSLGVLAVYEDQGFILNGVAGFREFLERVERPVGIVADFGNILQSGETIEPFIRAFADRIVHVHLKDYRLPLWQGEGHVTRTLDGHYTVDVPLGAGCIDFAGCIGLLEQSGYRGCYALEFTEPADGSMPTAKALETVEHWLQASRQRASAY